MSRALPLVLVLVLVVSSVPVAAAPAAPPLSDPATAPLPSDPRLVTGRLANGLSYVIRRHPTAERRIGIWLHVHSGSLNETDATRGLAHYLEHLAFNGSANFPPGALVPFFESLGLTFGRDQNAFTSFDQTTYQIMVPAGRPEALDKAMLFMADVAGGLDLSDQEIERERRVILEEKRTRAGAEQRVGEYVLERLAPESTLGRRLPIGTEASIRAVTPADFREYYRRWYVPSNMTVIVAGDADPAAIRALIERHFGTLPTAPAPTPRPAGVRATQGTRGIVATDPELTRADLSLVRVEPARAPSTTVADFRRDVVEDIGRWAFGRRLDADAAAGRARWEHADASLYTLAGVARTANVRASGRPVNWREMLTDLGTALQTARLHGFSVREVEFARRALLANAHDAVSRDATLPLRTVLGTINRAITDREPILAPSQRLALLEQLLPGITPAEVSAAFAANFDPGHVVAVATLPAGTAVPDDAQLATLARTALDVRPAAIAEAAAPASLLARVPDPGSVAEQVTEPASGVTSLRLGNGVRVHHRAMKQREGEVIVAITLAGGAIEETATTRGFTEAAAQAWLRPASSRLTSTQLSDLLVGTRTRVDAHVGEDAVTLTIHTTPRDLEAAMQLAHLLLSDPVLERVVLERWRESTLRAIARRDLEPLRAVQHATAEALAPAAEARLRPLTRDTVARITHDGAQAWLTRLATGAPLEVAIVGDVPTADGTRLAARYLGSLPARDPIGDATLASLRHVTAPAGPINVARTLPTRTAQAAVVSGFRGADARNRADARMLTVAARVLSSRMYKTLREERQLVYGIGAVSHPAHAYPGLGLFVAQAPTDPERTGQLAREVEAMYEHFAVEGPTEAEVAVARRQIAAQLDEQLERPDFWADWLAANDYRARTPREPLDARAHYERASAAAVHETFRRYWRPAARFTIQVTPIEAAVGAKTEPARAPAGVTREPAPR